MQNQGDGPLHPWLAVKHGSSTDLLQDESLVSEFVHNIVDYLIELGVRIERDELLRLLNTDNDEEVMNYLAHALKQLKNNIVHPILIFIKDSCSDVGPRIKHEFANRFFMFNMTGDEVHRMVSTKQYDEVMSWCVDFSKVISRSYIDQAKSSLSEASNVVQQSNSNVSSSTNFQHLPLFERVFHALKYAKKVANDDSNEPAWPAVSELLEECLTNVFSDPEQNNAFLRLLLTVSRDGRLRKVEEFRNSFNDVLAITFQRSYIINVCNVHFRDEFRSVSHLHDMSILLLKLFTFYCDNDLIPFDEPTVIESWDVFMNLLNSVPSPAWSSVDDNTMNWLKETSRRLGALVHPPPRSDLPEEESCCDETAGEASTHERSWCEEPLTSSDQANVIETYVPFWLASELAQPPCDFRIMSEVPTARDICSREVPYLRRAVIEGHYDNAEHYLDVMFRLMREDMISPMRDGIIIHRMNGTTRYNRKTTDEHTADIAVFSVKLLGFECRSQTGDLFCYALLAKEAFTHPAFGRHVRYGQMVCLSRDNFDDDIHIGIVCERNEEVVNHGTIGIMFPERETIEQLKKNQVYKMAEASSYLEAYQFVLKTIKRIPRYRPLPLERYLVRGATEVNLPLYMRTETTPKEEKENAELFAHYETLREAALVKKLESFAIDNDKKPSRRKREVFGRSTFDSDSESEDEVFVPCEMPKNKRISSIAQQRITLRGREYDVKNLMSDFIDPSLDDSQRVAFIRALTSELAIIQGPPGTGKTFIGVEIMRALLTNRDRFGHVEPILVVCYTNTALDQFLEKVYQIALNEIEEGELQHEGPIAVRLGTMSKSDILKRAGAFRRDVIDRFKEMVDFKIIERLSGAMGDKRKAMRRLGKVVNGFRLANRRLMCTQLIMKVMAESHLEELATYCVTHKLKMGTLTWDEAMACWLLDKKVENGKSDGKADRTVMAKVDDEDEDSDFEAQDNGLEDENSTTFADMFRDLNNLLNENESSDSIYEEQKQWDICRESACPVMFSSREARFGERQSRTDHAIEAEVREAESSICGITALTAEEAREIRSIFTLPKQRRWQLYAYWRQLLKDKLREEIPIRVEEFKSECDRLVSLLDRQDAEIFRKALVIGCTTTGAAKFRRVLEKVKPRVLIVEEAAEVLEAHIVSTLLPTVEHCIFIGDHQQLRPNPAVYQLAREYGMEISMFERLVKNGFPYETLAVQHRMSPTITGTIVRPHFYNGLVDASSVSEYPRIRGMEKNLFFWTHTKADVNISMSYMNKEEVERIVALVRYLLAQGQYTISKITVIATYSAQVTELRRRCDPVFGVNKDEEPNLKIETVDSFQGRENDVIIVSMVRSCSEGIGFLGVSNRICVALTRARHAMYIIGNMRHLASNSMLWDSIAVDLDNKHLVDVDLPIRCHGHANLQRVNNHDELAAKAPNGGCTEVCGKPQPCGHNCTRSCHPIDDHYMVRCEQKCMKTCSNERYQHVCSKRCSELCGPCNDLIKVELPCGHTTTCPCFKEMQAVCTDKCGLPLDCGHLCSNRCMEPCVALCVEDVSITHQCGHVSLVACNVKDDSAHCTAQCDEMLPCGHRCMNKCGEPCTFDCEELVDVKLACGHPKKIKCHESIAGQLCMISVTRKMSPCGHTARVACHSPSDSRVCPSVCGAKLPCDHACLSTCSQCYKTGHRCGNICAKRVACGHLCTKKCGEDCEDCHLLCDTSCRHQRCGGTKLQYNIAEFGRKCVELCAMCPRACDNSCEHRSCTRLCFEECDVKACEATCSKRLACGHACVGLCAEKCPTLCGTCNETGYTKVLSQYGEEKAHGTKLIRLVQLECSHVFPVDYLDAHVRKCKETIAMPLCPKCNVSMGPMNRYAKIRKRITLELYKRRLARAFEKRKSTLWSFKSMQQKVMAEFVELTRKRPLFSGVKCFELVDAVTKLLGEWNRRVLVAEGSDDELLRVFYFDVSSLLLSFSQLLPLLLESYPRNIRQEPNLSEFCHAVFGRKAPIDCIKLAMSETLRHASTLLSCENSGAFVPKMRYLIRRCMYLFGCGRVVLSIKSSNQDLSVFDLQPLIEAVDDVHSADVHNDFEKHYHKFVSVARDVLAKNGMGHLWNMPSDINPHVSFQV